MVGEWTLIHTFIKYTTEIELLNSTLSFKNSDLMSRDKMKRLSKFTLNDDNLIIIK